MSVGKLYKWKIVSIIVVIVGIVFAGLMLYKSYAEQKEVERILLQENKFQEIVDECSNKQYESALGLADKLQEPYKSYYKDYVTYAMELDGWVGTEQELYIWLEEYFKFLDESGYINTEFQEGINIEVQVWSKVNDTKMKFNEKKDFISEAFLWQPQYNQIVRNYYTEIYELMWQNREFFKGEVVDGIVKIPVSSIIELDEKAFNLYKTSSNELENLQNNYKLNDDFKDFFADELNRMEDVYSNYSDFAISSMVSEDYQERENVYFSEENAANNYEVLSNAFSLNGLLFVSFDRESTLGGMFLGEDLPEFVDDISEGAFYLYAMVKEIYPSVEIESIESELVNGGDIYTDFLERFYD